MTDKPWEHEPNHVMFMSEAGYVCEIKRHPTHGQLNGYIYIPKGHPDFGKTYMDLYGYGDGGMYEDAPDVHGGWTYSDTKGDDDGAQYTVFGFDCNHAGDYAPWMAEMYKKVGLGAEHPGTYRDIAYVTEQLEKAAKQFKERVKP